MPAGPARRSGQPQVQGEDDPDSTTPRRSDLVTLQFTVTRPNQLWVADFTCVATRRGLMFVAFETGVLSRRIFACRTLNSLSCELALDAQGQALFDRQLRRHESLGRRVEACEWPETPRPADTRGGSGAFHAKFALADDRVLFMTSANLTEYAMTLNMEMGVLIRGGELPAKVEAHFAKLIEQGILSRI